MEQEINDIIKNNNTILDPLLSQKFENKIQKLYSISIPSIVLEYLSTEDKCFELEDLKQFFNHFGEVLNIILLEKKCIVLFKTFFIAEICKAFLQTDEYYKENKKKNFSIRWFDYEKDQNLLLPEIKPLFEDIYKKNIINIKNIDNKKLMNNQNNNNTNNNIGIKMNMNMNINNFNINAMMNPSPMTQNQNMVGLNNMQYLQLLHMAQMKNLQNNNIPQGLGIIPNYNFNPINQMQAQQQQKLMNLNMLIKKQNMNNMNNLNTMNNMNNIGERNNINNMNLVNNMNNNIKKNLINQNIQQMNNPQFNQNLQNNFNQNMINNPNNNNSNINNNNNNDEKNFGKYTCKYEILIANDKDFQIARRLIGSKGCNMKNIINECKSGGSDGENIKLRLRGQGSGYKEGPQNKESDEPLHLCISSKNPEEMKKACLLVDELLKRIHEDYIKYCEEKHIEPSNTQIAMRIENKNSNFKGK